MCYYLYDGLSDNDRRQHFYLDTDVTYRYLNGCSREAPAVSANQAKFKAVNKCFEIIGFKQQVRN